MKRQKRYRILTIIFLIAITAILFLKEGRTQTKQWDVVIVGGGISGPTAAYGLNDYNVLLLEKEDRLGGRIKTIEHHGAHLDVGALLIYNSSVLPFELDTER